jgi:ABC-2 type transport system ATP-binding protein
VERVRGGDTVIMTTHILEVAERMAERIGVIAGGRLIAQGTLDELRAMLGERDLLRLSGSFPGEAQIAAALAGLDGVEIVQAEPESLIIAAPRASRELPALLAALTRVGGEIRETTMSRPSLETLFIKLTGKELRE